jgi:hypothetical protein
MRIAIAVFLALHGVAHTPGFLASWRLAVLQGLPYHTTLFGGRLRIGDTGMRAVGTLWLMLAVAFVAIALATLFDRSWWIPAAAIATAASLALCAAEIPAARIGLAVNIALLLGLVVASRTNLVR